MSGTFVSNLLFHFASANTSTSATAAATAAASDDEDFLDAWDEGDVLWGGEIGSFYV